MPYIKPGLPCWVINGIVALYLINGIAALFLLIKLIQWISIHFIIKAI